MSVNQAVSQSTLSSRSLIQVIDQVIASGKITRTDEAHLLQIAMSWEQTLTGEEAARIQMMLRRLQMGLLRVVD